MAAARCACVRSPRRNPSRLNIPVGRLDHRAFWGLSKGNWTLVRPTSSSAARKTCAEATIRAVASASAVCAGGDGRGGAATLAATATNTPRQANGADSDGDTHVILSDGTLRAPQRLATQA